MAQIQSQMDQRRPAKYKDQHGRPWFAEVEKSTGQPCIPLQPEFVAPIVPPRKYIRTDPEIPGRVTINYNGWINDLREADRGWWRDAQIVGAAEHKEHFDANAPFSQTVLNKMGERPRVHRCRTPLLAPMGDAALPVIAAMRGNAWILGLTGPQGQKPKMPEKLAPFFAKPVDLLPEFADEFEELVGTAAVEALKDHPDAVAAAGGMPKKRGNPEALAAYRAKARAQKQPVTVAVDDDEWASAKE